MRHSTRRAVTSESASTATELFDLVISGHLRKVEAHEDGSWTITPAVGRPLMLVGPDAVAAYVGQAQGTGPAALTPVRALPAAPARPRREDEGMDEEGCGCLPGSITPLPPAMAADLMQARSISLKLAEWIGGERRTAAYDDERQAAAVRVATPHGIYTLDIPPAGRPFIVTRNGRRTGTLNGVRRVPANPDSYVATMFAAFLRDRGEI